MAALDGVPPFFARALNPSMRETKKQKSTKTDMQKLLTEKKSRWDISASATRLALVLVTSAFALGPTSRADEVLDWNAVLRQAVVTAGLPGAHAFRPAAIVHASVFDAVNGIHGRYKPIYVTERGPREASPRAAAIQAAYASLLHLFPAQRTNLDAQLTTSLANLAKRNSDDDEDEGAEDAEAVALGLAWGQAVADKIWAWRSTDGFIPTSSYTGSVAVAKWRPTPPAFANGLSPSLGVTTPWVIPSPSSFRPPGPPSLTSAQYATDFKEVKSLADTNSTTRTADQTQAARFWQGTALTVWNRTAAAASLRRHLTFEENARLFALLNVAMADGVISCWDAKYFFEFWRPYHAIRLASTDGNPDTEEQADWTPVIPHPPYPEYSSGHATITGAAHAVLTIYFGDNIPVQAWSEALGQSTIRSWPNFTAAADEANVARIWGGMHFRFSVHDARAAGDAIGAYVMAHAAQPIRRHEREQDQDNNQNDQN